MFWLTRKNLIRLAWAAAFALAVLVRLPTADGFAHYYRPERDRELVAVRQIAAGDLPLVGPVQNMDNRYHFGALYWYLLFPLTWLGGFADWSVPLTSGLFSLVAVVAGLRLVRRWFQDDGLALTYGAVAAFSSLDIQFTKYASTPNLVPLVALGLFACLYEFLEKRGNPWLAGAIGILLAAAAQLHPVAGASLTLIVLILAVLRRFRPGPLGWTVLIAGAALVYLPYLYYDATHGFDSLQGLLSLTGGHRTYGNLWTRITENGAFWFSLWFNVHHLFGLPNLIGLGSLWAFLATIAALIGLWLTERGRPTNRLRPLDVNPSLRLMLTLWLAVPSALLLIPTGRISQVYIYYFAVLLPLGHLGIALGFRRLRELGLQRTAYAALGSFFVWQAAQIAIYEHFYPSVLVSRLVG